VVECDDRGEIGTAVDEGAKEALVLDVLPE
jgi:hypothetical protein